MVQNWDIYTRQGLDLATAATSFGFRVVKTGTRIGFSITRGIASTAVGITSTFVDHAFFGGCTVTRPVLGGAVTSVITLAEQITLAPIHLGEYITTASLLAAHSSINVLSAIIPGSSEASFSLASFITLVKQLWNEPIEGQSLPPKQYGITQVARAIVAWVALQGVTQEWQEKRWFKYLREIHVKSTPRNFDSTRSRRGSRIRVTSDVIFSGNRGQIIAADIGEVPSRAQSVIHPKVKSIGRSMVKRAPIIVAQHQCSDAQLKSTLRRLSKMVLAGYGGASLLFFGVSPTAAYSTSSSASSQASKAAEERQLAHAIDASEAEAAGESDDSPTIEDPQYSWWDVLLGRHDQEIFERFANSPHPDEKAKAEFTAQMRATAVVGAEHLMPRFWVLTDHGRAQIVLVLRGTMSLNEIAVDLTCEPEEFEPATTSRTEGHKPEIPIPGHFHTPDDDDRCAIPFPSSSASSIKPRYHVHSGMLRMARAMGDVGKPVQLAVHEALQRNTGYELVLCGHSLGAGVAALLGMLWADPETCLTVYSSGLPIDRPVSVYCFAPPCLCDASLCKLSSNLITSFVYSHDVVTRLSLGSIRDLKNAAMWLCEAEDTSITSGNSSSRAEGFSAITSRARQWKADTGSPDDWDWFIAVRKTLEANMQMSDMYPPGRVLWTMRDGDLHPSHRSRAMGLGTDGVQGENPEKLRLFEVRDVEKVFDQIVFARDMLSAHMPHQYDRVLHDLL